MKKDHPQKYDVVYIDSSSEKKFFTLSTVKSDETMEIDGKTYFVFRPEVTSDTHPVYTGKRRIIDSEGRAERFNSIQANANKK